jgi:hypothetical protein
VAPFGGVGVVGGEKRDCLDGMSYLGVVVSAVRVR